MDVLLSGTEAAHIKVCDELKGLVLDFPPGALLVRHLNEVISTIMIHAFTY